MARKPHRGFGAVIVAASAVSRSAPARSAASAALRAALAAPEFLFDRSCANAAERQHATRNARLVRARRAVAAQTGHPRVRRGMPEGGAPAAAEQGMKIPLFRRVGGRFVETN